MAIQPRLDRPAFYALRRGGWRDLVTLLHPPYTAWHLSYVALGAAAAPVVHVDRLLAALAAFFLAVGIAAHALDELHGRPLGTRISRAGIGDRWPSWVSLGAIGIGIAGAVTVSADAAALRRRRRLPRRRLQPGAVRRPVPQRPVVRGGVGSLSGADRLLGQRAVARRGRGARRRRLLGAERCAAAPEHAGPRAAATHGGRRGPPAN